MPLLRQGRTCGGRLQAKGEGRAKGSAEAGSRADRSTATYLIIYGDVSKLGSTFDIVEGIFNQQFGIVITKYDWC